ncbi:MAG: hypothetical protein C5B54_07485 [Acidobacteria bacterium]|nr:MAG: hypothetical protein C5B54_07485 [Acidobacteriota bacterium]
MNNWTNLDTAEFNPPALLDLESSSHPLSSAVTLQIAASTHIGKVRTNNEDAYLVYKIGRYWEKLNTSLAPQDLPDHVEEKAYALAVADGIGGSSGGEIASKMALRVIVNLVLNSPKWSLKLDHPTKREQEIQEGMQRAEIYFKKADEVLTQYTEAYPRLKGMGTTLTGAYVFGRDLITLHVGDSRAYLFRNGNLYQLTEDQTMANFLYKMGQINEKQAASHKLRHTLMSCLGGQEGKISMETNHYELYDGDRLLLCTDGLTEMVSSEKITEFLRNEKPTPKEDCEQLVDAALSAGGKDNITVILGRYSAPPDTPHEVQR